VTVRIAIVGAGPAGLTAALAARRLGLEAVVYEQAPELGRVGGGIAIQSNGQRVLHALGLLSGFERHMAMAHTVVVEGPGGRRYARLDYGALRVPFPRFAVVLRTDLQQHLLRAADHNAVPIELGRRCTGVVRDGPTTGLRFGDGSAVECTTVLGADGMRSAVRSEGGFTGVPRPVGDAALRGVVDRPVAAGVAREIWLDDGRLFGIAPLPERRSYFYCSAPLRRWPEVVANVEPWIAGWRDALPEAGDVLDAVTDWDRVSYDELHEVNAPRWWRGGCFLLGDAAHAMTPNLGQGANSAMVDALVLVRLLRTTLDAGGTLDDVGRRYQAIRRPFVRRVQAASHAMSRIAGWRSPAARLARRGILALGDVTERFGQVGLRLGAGVNPLEERYLQPLDPLAPA
jgi:2-polyprenyl-6-methoxyphenol hydroxylase-like FAD-dependent oxidoreductase